MYLTWAEERLPGYPPPNVSASPPPCESPDVPHTHGVISGLKRDCFGLSADWQREVVDHAGPAQSVVFWAPPRPRLRLRPLEGTSRPPEPSVAVRLR